MNRTLGKNDSQMSMAGAIALIVLASAVLIGMYLTGVKVF